jgi:hypothetical protein
VRFDKANEDKRGENTPNHLKKRLTYCKYKENSYGAILPHIGAMKFHGFSFF